MEDFLDDCFFEEGNSDRGYDESDFFDDPVDYEEYRKNLKLEDWKDEISRKRVINDLTKMFK